MPPVLFVCTGNQFRSHLAAACFKRLWKDQGSENGWVVDGAGTWAIRGQPLPGEATAAAARPGMNIEDHHTRMISEQLLRDFDLIVVMERGQKEAVGLESPAAGLRVHLLTKVSGNPAGEGHEPISPPSEIYKTRREACSLMQQGSPRMRLLAEYLAGSRT